jgi:hypothetical protein
MVLDFFKKGNLLRAIRGENVGTLVIPSEWYLVSRAY